MKSIRKVLRFLRGRWMRRLVWLPCSLIAFLFLGATLQSKGFKLSLLPPVRTQPSHVFLGSNGQSPATPTMASIPSTSRRVEVDRLPRVNQISTNVFAPAQAPNSGQPIQYQSFQTVPIGGTNQWNAYPSAVPSPQQGVQAYVPNNAFNAPLVSQSASIPRPDVNQANQIAASINKIRGLHGNDTAAMRDCLGELLELILLQFEEKQSRERTELKHATDTLTIWEEAIEQRENLKKPLIESYIAQLLQTSDPLNWSFSGAELLKSKPNHANYQEILKQLWMAKTNHEVTPCLPSTQLPEISTDKDPPGLPAVSAY